MNSTHFANASGLPNGEQVTTARDLAILGRAIEARFPRYYRMRNGDVIELFELVDQGTAVTIEE